MTDAKKYRVGILGATGTVGQRFAQLLDGHPQFQITALAASDRSAGKTYADACQWKLTGEMPAGVRDLVVTAPEPNLNCDLVFSSMPGEMARATEGAFAAAGYPVISNSSAYRMDADVPLLVPEINHDHLRLIDVQRTRTGSKGYIVTNPNCSTIMLTLPLAPLNARFALSNVLVTTMQALSGAGYPGVSALDVVDNVVPFIAGEEEKIETETRKIFGRFAGDHISLPRIAVSAQCHRVNVLDGHLGAIRMRFCQDAELEEIIHELTTYTSLPQELKLFSAPARPIIVRNEDDRPQPRLDRDAGAGMSVTVGRIRTDNVLGFRFVALSHNTIRGAAGAAILNAELLAATGYL